MTKLNIPDTVINFVEPDTGELISVDLKEEVGIHPSSINDDLVQQSSKYVWYSVLYEQQKKILEDLKIDLNALESKLDEKIRKDMVYNGEKVTESVVNKRVHGHIDYCDLCKRISKQKYIIGVLDQLLKAYEQRMNALITLGANIRTENKSYH